MEVILELMLIRENAGTISLLLKKTQQEEKLYKQRNRNQVKGDTPYLTKELRQKMLKKQELNEENYDTIINKSKYKTVIKTKIKKKTIKI